MLMLSCVGYYTKYLLQYFEGNVFTVLSSDI